MISKEELKTRNSEFWTEFQNEMRNVRSSSGRRMNWINYPTGVKDVYVRMETNGKSTIFALDIQPKDDGIRSILWEQMTELRRVLEDEMGEATEWSEYNREFAGRTISRVYWQTDQLNFFNDADLPAIRKFLREKVIAFDVFYEEFKEILITLAH